jgi:pilus assembly protein CpaB
MNSIIMLLLAFVFGTGAVFLTKIWLNNQQASLITPVEATATPTATIVVAAVPMRFGDQLQVDKLSEIPWPTGNVPTGTFSTKEELLEAGERYVITALEVNEPILGWKITGPGQRATLSAVVEEGMKAVTIRVDDVLGVAGFVLPGDRVDILLTRAGSFNDDDANAYVDVLLQGVKVLAIDQSADDRKDQPVVVKAVTLEVSTEQAQKLTLASTVGRLSLALRNIASGDGENTRRISVGDLSAEAPFESAEAEEVVAGPQGPLYSTIGVIRATERSEYQVKSQ